MKTCTVCKKHSSSVLMNNRWVCFSCDELLFDIEIESDDVELTRGTTTVGVKPQRKNEVPLTKQGGQK